jgi:invasion protein IalB
MARMLAVAALLAAMQSTVAAQTAAPTGPRQPGEAQAEAPAEAAPAQSWTVNCSSQGTGGDLVCAMSQTLIAKNTGQRVVSAAVFRSPQGGYAMRFSLPHGIMLPAGIEVWIDEGQRSKHEIATADQNGSYSTMPVNDATAGALRAGQILNLLVKAASGDEIIFQLSLKGFTQAFAKL